MTKLVLCFCFTLLCLLPLILCHQQAYMAQQQQAQMMGGVNPQGAYGGHQHGVPVQQVQQGGANQNLIRDKSHIQDREHIKEHLLGVVDHPDVAKMSEEELQFHYFKMHDNDDNNKLDGCELIKSLIHWHVEESKHIASGGQVPPGQVPQGQVPQGQVPQGQIPQGHQHGGHQQGVPQPGGAVHGGAPADGGLGTTKIFTDSELAMMIDPILDMDDRNKDGFIDYPEFVAAQQSRGF